MDPQVSPDSSASESPPPERREAHNASMDQRASKAGACAQIHLQTGRVCTLPHGHEGSCDFIAADQVDASLASYRSRDLPPDLPGVTGPSEPTTHE